MLSVNSHPTSFPPLYQPGGVVIASSVLIKGNGNTGATAENDDWRFTAPAQDLLTQKLEAGVWNTKETVIP